MGDPWGWLEERRAAVRAAGLTRTPQVVSPGLVDLASNDYLGLSRHPAVVEAAAAAARSHGAGSTGSRLVTGTTDLHLDLERELSLRTGSPAALVFSSGYLANLAAVCTLAGPGTLIVSDRRNHASLIDACRLSRASLAVVDDVDSAALALESFDGRAVVVTDSVFSTDGSLADLVGLHDLARRHGALLLVDEAHALGVLGPGGAGAVALAGLEDEPDVVRTVTLSKSLGSQGGAVLGPSLLRDHLVDTARTFVFDTGLAPPSVGAALAALSLVTPDRLSLLASRSALLSELLGLPPTPGPIARLLVGDPFRAVELQRQCREQGVLVGCFRPPSVPHGESSLRLTSRADLTDADLERAAAVLGGVR